MRTAAAAPGSHDGLDLFLFAAAYLVAYGYGSLFSHAVSAPLWFPDSVLLCALLLAPQNKWWPYFVIAVPMRFIRVARRDSAMARGGHLRQRHVQGGARSVPPATSRGPPSFSQHAARVRHLPGHRGRTDPDAFCVRGGGKPTGAHL